MTNSSGENGIPVPERYNVFVEPRARTGLTLRPEGDGLVDHAGTVFRFHGGNPRVVDFMKPYVNTHSDAANIAMYDQPHSTQIYKNFLDWLFSTFGETERDFREKVLEYLDLQEGQKVLITGCGLGEDVMIARERVGPSGEVHAQDISKSMVSEAEHGNSFENVVFSISNANSLPYADKYFDAAFHFGGINLTGNTKAAIAELGRVCKGGGECCSAMKVLRRTCGALSMRTSQ